MNSAISILWPLLLACTGASADEGRGGNGHPPPPREAIDACSDKDSGDDCSFSGRDDETVSGSCFTPADDKPLACRPDSPPPRRQEN